MKKLLLLFVAACAFISCNTNARENAAAVAQKEVAAINHVEVLYFHGKQRCATCMAIESNAKAALAEHFAEQMKNGDVVFRVIDISQKENEALAEKYEVTWSSLLVVKYKDGQETYENLTDFAFGHARKSPEDFKVGVVEAINAMLQ